jgi:surface carbohydrate biosynthesis protein
VIINKWKKAVSFCNYYFSAKKVWHFPERSEILIFDAAGKNILMPFLEKWSPEILHVRNEVISIPILILSFFRSGKRLVSYCDCYIERVKPKLIITHIDNNPNFYTLSLKHKGITTIFLQNGLRSYHLDIFEMLDSGKFQKHDFHVDYMATFGSSVGQRYKKYISGECIPIGSVKNNAIKKRTEKSNGTIVFISQYRGDAYLVINGRKITHKSYFEDADKIVLTFLIAYAKKNQKQLSIATYNMQNDGGNELQNEIAYYNNLGGIEFKYIIRENAYSSYHALDAAEVTVSVDSSLAYESAARGNKTAFFSIRGDLLQLEGYNFGWPAAVGPDGSFWTSFPDENRFGRILDYLFSLDDSMWKSEITKNNFQTIISYDAGNKTIGALINQVMAR